MRAWWDGEPEASIECPIGDFFGIGYGIPPGAQDDLSCESFFRAGQGHPDMANAACALDIGDSGG
ncbi:MAG: DUF2961 domain-containing protein [Omnitrophica WOR_2 bacterium]